MIKIKYDELKSKIYEIFLNLEVSKNQAEEMAKIMADSTLDGVNSHGVNRLPLLVKYIREGVVKKNNSPVIINNSNIIQVDGNYSFGILNAKYCTEQAINRAKDNGVGVVSLKNTNHWHRAGTYGWLAAEQGMILIAWTNTIPIIPPYSSKENLIGNNPFVISIPREKGHIVLDMALSQYSYGKMANYSRQKKELEEFGGYDRDGNLTKDAYEIKNFGKHYPIGFWKGTALTFVLDILAAILSGGRTTYRLGKNEGIDTGMSQIYIAIDPKKFGDQNFQQSLIDETINFYNQRNEATDSSIHYPGEKTLIRRQENLISGIPIEKTIWEKVINL